MKFKTKYNFPEKLITTSKPCKMPTKKQQSEPELETNFLTTNVKNIVHRLSNRDLFDENMDKIDINDKKFQVGKLI